MTMAHKCKGDSCGRVKDTKKYKVFKILRRIQYCFSLLNRYYNKFGTGSKEMETEQDLILQELSYLLKNSDNNASYDSICDEAKEITGDDRMKQYGHPRQNFADIAALWTSFIKNKAVANAVANKDGGTAPTIDAKDVAMMMILFKVAREQAGHKRDNIVDIAGYARNIAQIEGEE